MKFDLDEKDLRIISRAELYFCMDDEAPESLYKGFIRLVKKINSQIPEPIPAGATRRIKIFKKEMDTHDSSPF